MKKLEIILIAGAVLGLLLTLLNVPFSSLVVSIFFLALGLLYFYLGFALFNDIPLRKIFEPESYRGIGTWRIIIAVGTGLALSILTIGFMFTILDYPMAQTLLTFGLVLGVIILILAIVKNAREKNRFYRNIIIRCIVYIIIAVVFLLIPDHVFEKL